VTRRIALALLVLTATLASAQTPRDAVRFRWSRIEREKKTGKARLGWTFENPNPAAVTFSYRLRTDLDEIVTGRMTLAGGHERIGGWLFSGDRFTRAEISADSTR
jgi:hypothetical protein